MEKGEKFAKLGNIVQTHWEARINGKETPPPNIKGKKKRHLECMLGPSHWLYEISLPKRLGHHFWPRLTPYLFSVGAHLIFKKKTDWFFKHFRSRELPVLDRPKP
jgi:hypothetical protein